MSKSLNMKLFFYQVNMKNNKGNKILPKNYPHYIEQIIRMKKSWKSDVKENIISELKCLTTVANQDSLSQTITFDYHYDNKRYIYIKMSKPQDVITMGKMNLDTLSYENLDIKGNEVLIKSSYLLIDCDLGVITFLGNRSTPSIQSFITLLNGQDVFSIKKEKVQLSFDIIKLSNDIALDSKKIRKLSSIEFAIASEANKLFQNFCVFGQLEKEIKPNIKNKKVKIVISGIENDDDNIQSTIDFLKELKEIDAAYDSEDPTNPISAINVMGKLQETETYVSKHDLLDSKLNIFTKLHIQDGYHTQIGLGTIITRIKNEYENNLELVKSKLTTN